MSEIKTGGPAFPGPDLMNEGQFIGPGAPGMTLRDYFAAKSLNAVISNNKGSAQNADIAPKIARSCYEMADAMLAAREAA